MYVKSYFDLYSRHRPLFLSILRAKEASLYQPYLPLPHPVLDVGCGDGFFAYVAFAQSRSMKERPVIDIGLDVPESRVGEAPALGVYGKTVLYDGKHFPFPEGFFRTIVSNSVLEHIPNMYQVLKESHRVLDRHGSMYVTVMAKAWEEHLAGSYLFGNFYRRSMRRVQVHHHLLTARGWQDVFHKTGFHTESVRGYLTPGACRLIDICHYLSFPSLVSYKLFRRWVLWPSLIRYPSRWLARVVAPDDHPEKAGALFFVLRRQ